MTTLSYTIKPLQNGFLVEDAYRLTDPNKDAYDGYSYKQKKYMYADWAGVVEFVNSNPIAIPQAD